MDRDVRPVGITYQIGEARSKTFSSPFLTLGAYLVNTIDSGRDEDAVNLFQLQSGIIEDHEDYSYKFALGFQHFDHSARDTILNEYGQDQDEDYGFDILDIYAEVTIKMGHAKWRSYGQFGTNFSAKGSVSTNVTHPEAQLTKKHLSIVFHFVCENCAANILEAFYIPSNQNSSDFLTKALSKQLHLYHTDSIFYPFRVDGSTLIDGDA